MQVWHTRKWHATRYDCLWIQVERFHTNAHKQSECVSRMTHLDVNIHDTHCDWDERISDFVRNWRSARIPSLLDSLQKIAPVHLSIYGAHIQIIHTKIDRGVFAVGVGAYSKSHPQMIYSRVCRLHKRKRHADTLADISASTLLLAGNVCWVAINMYE